MFKGILIFSPELIGTVSNQHTNVILIPEFDTNANKIQLKIITELGPDTDPRKVETILSYNTRTRAAEFIDTITDSDGTQQTTTARGFLEY